ncbi:MAG: YeeE/YedE family protein [Rhodopseudomonas sp.]|nr:YeeE/YedE family protein [Rhodopseudomonas sp.]
MSHDITSVLPPFLVRTVLGFGLGILLGFAARRGRFCTVGAIEDVIYSSDRRRAGAWVLAVAVAIIGVHALELWGGLDLSRSIYTGSRIEWGGAIIGGLLFGVGMALVGTCGFGTLLRLGGGDLKALVTFLVMAVTAMVTMRGLIGMARVRITDPLTVDLPHSMSQRLPGLIAALTGWSGLTVAIMAMALGALVGIAVFASGGLSRAALKQSLSAYAPGLAIGVIVVLGWWATGIAGFDVFDARRVESFSFVAPLGDTLLYFMLSSGVRPDFPVGAVLGVVLGACLAARSAGQFRWEAPDGAGEMRRHLLGAVLMGVGGIAALGCTIGQGVTGISTLSVGSMLSIASILVGARVSLYWLIER